ncbi:hypothetical protein AJ88_15885 [Mesorhizobium amorphae CCBAU 01583]|nr:hypothetical protein AJ88_15885 [Mesorhizobium amorphae CCBAU 01583]
MLHAQAIENKVRFSLIGFRLWAPFFLKKIKHLSNDKLPFSAVSCRAVLQLTTVDFQGFPATIGESTRHGRDMGGIYERRKRAPAAVPRKGCKVRCVPRRAKAIDAGAAVTLIPGASYAIGQIVERFVAAPLQKRRDQWFTKVGEGLRDLQDRLQDFDPSKLDENDDFVSAVAEATPAAVRTAKEEKIEALRNGVLNIAAGLQIDDILRGAFFGCIERFSPAHVRVLGLLADPSSSPEMKAKASQMMAGAQMSVLEAALPSSVISAGALSRVLSDLHREGLADTSGLMAWELQASSWPREVPALGTRFCSSSRVLFKTWRGTMGWLGNKVLGWSTNVQKRELEEFVGWLRALDGSEVGMIVACATNHRHMVGCSRAGAARVGHEDRK